MRAHPRLASHLMAIGLKKKVFSALMFMLIPTVFIGYWLPRESNALISTPSKPTRTSRSVDQAKLSGFKKRIHQKMQTTPDLKIFWSQKGVSEDGAGFARVALTNPAGAAIQTVSVGTDQFTDYSLKYLGSLPKWSREIFALMPNKSSLAQVVFITIDKAGHFIPLEKKAFHKPIAHFEICGSTEDELVLAIAFVGENQFHLYSVAENAVLKPLGKAQTAFDKIAEKVLPFGEKSLLSLEKNEVRIHEFEILANDSVKLSERVLETPEFIEPDLLVSVPYEHSVSLLMHNQKQRTMQVLSFHGDATKNPQLINLDNDEKWDNLLHIPNSRKTIWYKRKSKLFADQMNVLSSETPEQWSVEQTLSTGRYIEHLMPLGEKSINDTNFYALAHANNPIRVLHATLEYFQSEVGGIAAVTKTLIPQLNRGTRPDAVVAQVIMPKFAFLRFPEKALEEIAQVEHYYKKSWVKSAVLRGSDSLLVIEPKDPAHKNMFKISDKNGLYTDDDGAAPIERWLYFDSAVAAFVSQYKEPASHQPFHVLHMHSYHVSVAAELLDAYDSFREQRGIPKPKTVFHMHGLSYDQGWIKGELLTGVGLESNLEWENLTKRTLDKVDMAVTVSKNMLEDGSNEIESLSFGLSSHFRTLAKSQRIQPVLNGINTAQWDPSDKKLMSIEGTDLSFNAENIQEGKARIKSYLKSRGHFSDSDRPLVSFVGRFSDEKGIEHLQSAAREIIRLGGNFAIMGSYGKSYNSREMILNLKELAQGELSGRLLILDTVEAQKENNLGMFVRAASDFSFVPSREETCGLVPIEFFTLGALTITSYVGGLKDTVIPYSPDAAYFNGFVFNYNDSDQLYWSINQAFTAFKTPQFAGIRKKVMKEALNFDWSTPGGAVTQIVEIYKKVVEQ